MSAVLGRVVHYQHLVDSGQEVPYDIADRVFLVVSRNDHADFAVAENGASNFELRVVIVVGRVDVEVHPFEEKRQNAGRALRNVVKDVRQFQPARAGGRLSTHDGVEDPGSEQVCSAAQQVVADLVGLLDQRNDAAVFDLHTVVALDLVEIAGAHHGADGIERAAVEFHELAVVAFRIEFVA